MKKSFSFETKPRVINKHGNILNQQATIKNDPN